VATYDLPARAVTVQMRLVRVWFIGDGNYQEDIVARPIVSTVSGGFGQIRVDGPDGYSAAVTPFWGTDGTVLLTAELRVWDNGTLLAPARWQQTVKAGQSARLTGVTDAKSARVQELARKGQAPRQWAPATFNIYYLDVTPVATATTDAAKPVAAAQP
jgi:hypothetical protein